MWHPEKDMEASKLIREVAMDEARLDLLDKKIEEQKAYLNKLFKDTSDINNAMKCDKIDSTDKIEAMEKLELLVHMESLSLSSFSVERSRLVRTIMHKNATIRRLSSEADSSEEEDIDEIEFMQETWAATDVFMDKTSVLEDHVKEKGSGETTFVLKAGHKAALDEDMIASWGKF